jgi:zeta-carotene desaturase
MEVLIVGGGLAGLSTAVELLDRGHRVTVLERDARLGGKAASWRDADGDAVDMGQHVVTMGQHVVTPLYEHFLALAKRVGADRNIRWKEGDYLVASRGGRLGSIRIANLPPPLHFIAGLLRYRHLGLWDRLSGVPAFAEILLSTERHRRKYDDRTFVEWVKSRGATDALVAHLLEPMIEGLMFLNCHEVSATNVMFDLHYMLLNREASRFGFFDGGLDETLIQPIARHIRERGGIILTGQPVRRFRFEDGGVACLEMADGRRWSAERYVSAVPVHQLCAMLPNGAWAEPYFAGWRRLEPVPVIGVQVTFDRKVTTVDNLMLTPECVFNAYADASNILTEYRGRAGSIVHFVVAPAQAWIGAADDAIVRAVVDDFRDVFPAARDARVVKSVVVKTPQAFHRQSRGMEQFRPVARSPIRGLTLAGEFTRNKYPPCMEGAVMSGILAAKAVHEGAARGPPEL